MIGLFYKEEQLDIGGSREEAQAFPWKKKFDILFQENNINLKNKPCGPLHKINEEVKRGCFHEVLSAVLLALISICIIICMYDRMRR